MRRIIFVLLFLILIPSCNRRLFVERTNSNGTHVKTLDAQIFNKTIQEKDLDMRKEVVLSDEDASGIIVRLQKDSAGFIKIKTYVPKRTVVIKNKTTNENVKILPKRKFNKLRTFGELAIIFLVILLLVNYLRKMK